MKLTDEIRRSLTGCYRFVRGDPQALGYFNLSVDGFYRSFTAMLLIVPAILIYSLITGRLAEEEISVLRLALSELAITFTSWLAFLGAIFVLARYFDVAENFPTFVVVYNWSQLFITLIWLPLILFAMVLGAPSVLPFLSVMLLAASYYYLWYIIMRSLAVSIVSAIGFALLEFLIALAVRQIAGSF